MPETEPAVEAQLVIRGRVQRVYFRESMKTHYETLGILKDASAQQIKSTYRILVKMHHPDKFPETTRKLEAEERLRTINAAYAVLSNAARRASYDATLKPPPSDPEPELCGKCGRPTTYWRSNRRAPLCNACSAKASELNERASVKRQRAGA